MLLRGMRTLTLSDSFSDYTEEYQKRGYGADENSATQ